MSNSPCSKSQELALFNALEPTRLQQPSHTHDDLLNNAVVFSKVRKQLTVHTRYRTTITPKGPLPLPPTAARGGSPTTSSSSPPPPLRPPPPLPPLPPPPPPPLPPPPLPESSPASASYSSSPSPPPPHHPATPPSYEQGRVGSTPAKHAEAEGS
ncbi:MAG: hypothetical protein M1812_004014 [Candelaria pacifica]|nr:MAG: hypothetical protein M1812_004014 [Candelaria pacifica]